MDEDKLLPVLQRNREESKRTLESALSQSTEPGKETPRVGT